MWDLTFSFKSTGLVKSIETERFVGMNRCATGSHQNNKKLVKKMSKTKSDGYGSRRFTVSANRLLLMPLVVRNRLSRSMKENASLISCSFLCTYWVFCLYQEKFGVEANSLAFILSTSIYNAGTFGFALMQNKMASHIVIAETTVLFEEMAKTCARR